MHVLCTGLPLVTVSDSELLLICGTEYARLVIDLTF